VLVRGSCKAGSTRAQASARARRCRGQSLIETILLMPLMLLIVLNVINFGYFFVIAVNLAAAPRSGVEYSIVGSQSPSGLTLPAAGPPSTITSISHLSQQDLTGAINAPTGATLQVCSETVGLNNVGLSTQTSQCVSCTGSSCTSSANLPDPDPEAPNFILNRVDVTYTFSPLIPGTPFGVALLPMSACTASGGNVTCTFHRQVSMRVMN
jgi:hypothetical protein